MFVKYFTINFIKSESKNAGGVYVRPALAYLCFLTQFIIIFNRGSRFDKKSTPPPQKMSGILMEFVGLLLINIINKALRFTEDFLNF